MALSTEQRVLAAIARGILGDAYQAHIPGEILRTVAHAPSESDRAALLRMLRWLDTRAGALALTGRPVPVSWRTASETEAIVQRWKRGRVKGLRILATALVSASVEAAYGHPGPCWDRIGYPGPYGSPPDVPLRLAPTRINGNERLECDVVIVGSGPGGSTVASHLARAGLDVIILEKGGYYAERDFHHLESRSLRELYLYGGTLATHDGGIRILAGSTVGGGALVNYTISFAPPERVRQQWRALSGLDLFTSDELEESLAEVSTRLNVNRDSSALNPRERPVEEGLKHLGWHVDQMPRSVKDCPQDEQCGYCGFGCRHGAKQSPRVFLEEAVGAGAVVVVDTDVKRVLVDGGRAVGIEGRSGRHHLRVDARKAVVVACGAIESPALLLRSGLTGAVGHYLHLHPGAGVCGLFAEEARPWEGVQMSRYSDQVRDWDDGYGPIYESVPIHPAAYATLMPWDSAAEHARQMNDYRYVSVFGPLLRDTTEGRVSLDKRGGVRVDYTLGPDDERRAVRAVIDGAKVFEAAGARRIWTMHTRQISYVPGRNGAYDRWVDEVRGAGYKPTNSLFGSFHQMGTCRMGVDPSSSVVDGDHQTHELRGLYVVDGSNFPDASGVNPMLTIFGLANRAGKRLAESLS